MRRRRSSHLVPQVRGEPHEPDLAVPHLQLLDHGGLGVLLLPALLALLQPTSLPADDRVLAGLGQDEVAEPPAAVHVVPVDVPRAEVGEVAEL